jgi:hypothetical protein
MKSCCKDAENPDDSETSSPIPKGNGKKENWFRKLKHKWQVKNDLQLILILCTFAIGGSLSGYFARVIREPLGLSHPALKVVVYIILITILWPLCVLVISIFLGQFSFFKKYLKKLGNRIIGRKTDLNKKSP